jgi:hypothetical protein
VPSAENLWFPQPDRLKKYGITLEEWKQMLERQGNACAICGDREAKLVIDHSHKTNKVRGLLCNHCNTGLGMFKDRRASLRAALLYLDGLYEDTSGPDPCEPHPIAEPELEHTAGSGTTGSA